jgi:hypothetical protein
MEPNPAGEVNTQDYTAEGFERYKPTIEAENTPQQPKPVGKATVFARRVLSKLEHILLEKPLPK